ncbi:reverse transcriptase domain-containing protein [Tanacetum coccineum]
MAIRYVNRFTSTIEIPDVRARSIKLMLFPFSLAQEYAKSRPRFTKPDDKFNGNAFSKFVNSNTASSSSSGSLPSNTVTNPKEDLKGITTRSGVAYQGPTIPTSSPKVVERRTEGWDECVAIGDLPGKPNLMPFSVFSDMIACGILLPVWDPIVSILSSDFSPFVDSDFLLLEEADAFLALADDPTSPENIKICEVKCKSSIDEPPEVELKDLPPHLEYAFLEDNNKLPVIIAKDLSVDESCFMTVSKVQYELAGQHQRRVHQRIPRCVIKKRLKYFLRQINLPHILGISSIGTTFPFLSFMDQMLERLAGNEYYCFLDGFSGYFQIPSIKAWEYQHFTCPYELKDLPPHLEYAFLEDNNKLPVIISKDLSVDEKTTLIKKEVEKLLDAGLIYPISDSPWVSPVHCVPKKGGMIVLNEATRKDHFPLPFMDQMLERLVGNEYYCFLDGFSGYFQIPIDPKDQEKTTFTCPYGTFAYRRMPFGLCNAPGMFQRCMMAIFHDMIEKTMEVFMDDFSVFRNSFSTCLYNLEKMLKRCEDTNLALNWEKIHFMVKEGIILGHKISKKGIEVDKAKIDVIAKLPYPTTVKGIRSFLGHAGFYRRFIKDFSKISRPMTHLLEKNTPFIFSEECIQAFQTLKKKLTEAPILIAPN